MIPLHVEAQEETARADQQLCVSPQQKHAGLQKMTVAEVILHVAPALWQG